MSVFVYHVCHVVGVSGWVGCLAGDYGCFVGDGGMGGVGRVCPVLLAGSYDEEVWTVWCRTYSKLVGSIHWPNLSAGSLPFVQ